MPATIERYRAAAGALAEADRVYRDALFDLREEDPALMQRLAVLAVSSPCIADILDVVQLPGAELEEISPKIATDLMEASGCMGYPVRRHRRIR